MADLKRVNVRMSNDMHAWLKEMAEKRGITMNAMMIIAIENYYREVSKMDILGVSKPKE